MSSETIDYKSLYMLSIVENETLLQQNAKLTKELEKYKRRYFRIATNEDDIRDIMEDEEERAKEDKIRRREAKHKK